MNSEQEVQDRPSEETTTATTMPMPAAADKLLQDVDKKLHEENDVTKLLAIIEVKTGLKRLHLVLGFLAIHALYLIFGASAEFVCNFIGFVYPAYMSILAIESNRKDDDTQWLTYWVIFALLSVLEFFSDSLVDYFPIYWLTKCVFLLYLYLPMTQGARAIYQRLIQPFAQKHKSLIDKHLGQVVNQINEKTDALRDEYEKHVKPN